MLAEKTKNLRVIDGQNLFYADLIGLPVLNQKDLMRFILYSNGFIVGKCKSFGVIHDGSFMYIATIDDSGSRLDTVQPGIVIIA